MREREKREREREREREKGSFERFLVNNAIAISNRGLRNCKACLRVFAPSKHHCSAGGALAVAVAAVWLERNACTPQW